ncbi:MAG: CDP-glycerol glycerophosphotransferase family protein [Steroidobacteraceae bacterium]
MSKWIKKKVERLCAGIWWLLGRVIPKQSRLVVLNTFPDFDDTARAMVPATRALGYRLVILTLHKQAPQPEWVIAAGVTTYYRYSLQGVWWYHRARFVFYTHGLFSAWPLSPRQCVVNVWHGMPIKRIGLLDGKSPDQIPRFHYTIASDSLFQGIVRDAFGVTLDQVLLADHPRINILKGRGRKPAGLPEHRQLAVWLPTYRAAKVGDVRMDGSSRGDIFAGATQLQAMDEFFASRGVVCIVKPHPMTKATAELFKSCKALVFFDEQTLLKNDMTLYQLLSVSDFMITDVSSVYVDYAVLQRPTVVFCQDLEEYRRSRGFTAPIESLVKEQIAVTEEQLCQRIDDALLGRAPHATANEVTDTSLQCTRDLFAQLEARWSKRAS